MKFITLMTDFGLKDGYTGVMRGVIYRIAPDVQIADISHTIHPQNVLEGSLVWKRSYSFFPEGTVHVGVVDPGVGTQRRPIAARIGRYFFVCPDNGMITPILEQAENDGEAVEIVHLDQERYWLQQVSRVFHGRDIFSPVAAHLASGVSLSELGTPIHDPVRKPVPEPKSIENGWQGLITTIDHFGNLSTNLEEPLVKNLKDVQLRIAGHEIRTLSRTFGEHAPGELVAFIDSDGCVAIAVVNGNAAQELDIQPGEPVELVSKA